MIIRDRFEFNLIVKRYGQKPGPRPYDPYPEKEEEKEELLEELNFKSLSAVEVIRKCLDYLSPFT